MVRICWYMQCGGLVVEVPGGARGYSALQSPLLPGLTALDTLDTAPLSEH